MQRVNQAVSSVSPHLAPDDLQSDSSAPAASDPADAPLTNVRQLYNEVFLPHMRQHLQATVHSDTSASQKPGTVKKVHTSHPTGNVSASGKVGGCLIGGAEGCCW